jgi:hypothetical protein
MSGYPIDPQTLSVGGRWHAALTWALIGAGIVGGLANAAIRRRTPTPAGA